LRETLREIDVGVLQFTITSNHVHLLLAASQSPEEVSRLMQRVQGQHAQAYNRRHNRHGAFWEDRFHATMVQDGPHLWRCLTYIDLNMVRAGAVGHPSKWEWTGYHELMGLRRRYRLIDLEQVREAVAARDLEEFRALYHRYLEERLKSGIVRREPEWSESIAVGSREFIEAMRGRVTHRRVLEAIPMDTQADVWALHEVPVP
jgi:putative transposase